VPGKCSSSIPDLQRREVEFSALEALANQIIKDKYGLWWDELPMPVALVDLISKIYLQFEKD
jgi:hypothetical protein